MDKLSQRLREDADRIETKVSPEHRKRIDASLAAAEREDVARLSTKRSRRLQWTSAVAGVAAAVAVVAVITVLNRPRSEPDELSATPEYTAELPNPVPLELRYAELTDPLQQELEHLRADVEKARATVERDLGVKF